MAVPTAEKTAPVNVTPGNTPETAPAITPETGTETVTATAIENMRETVRERVQAYLREQAEKNRESRAAEERQRHEGQPERQWGKLFERLSADNPAECDGIAESIIAEQSEGLSQDDFAQAEVRFPDSAEDDPAQSAEPFSDGGGDDLLDLDETALAVRDAVLNPAGWVPQRLSVEDLRQLVNAVRFARWLGKPISAAVTIKWDAIPDFDASPRAWVQRQGRLFDRMGKWLHRRGLPVHYCWVREVSRKNRIPHTHLLLHLPRKYRDAFRSFLVETGGFIDRPIPRSPVEISRGNGMTLYQQAGALKYLLKSADPAGTFRDPATNQTVNLMNALKVDDRNRACVPICGQRSRVSRALDHQARAEAGWKEIRTLARMILVLNPGG